MGFLDAVASAGQDNNLDNQATGYASQHYSVPVPSKDKLGGLWQEGHSV